MAFVAPLWVASLPAAEPSGKPSDKLYQQTVERAVNFLQTKGQGADGSFSPQVGPAVTAIVVTGLLGNGRSLEDPMVRKGLEYLTGFVRDDGGIYAEGSRIKNYETCVVLMAFATANDDHRYDKIIKSADAYIRGLQAEGLKPGPANVAYGGVGYGGIDPARLVEHRFFDRRTQSGRRRPRRQGDPGRVDLCLAVSKSGIAAQHDGVGR